MRSKDIFIIRHGETELNRKGMVQGSGVDSSLNNLGFLQAQAFFEAYRHLPFDKVYTSKLQRTAQSLQGFIEQGVPWQSLYGLNEISWGDKEGRPLTPEDDLQHEQMVKAWRSGDLSWSAPGGESPLQVMERQRVAWDYIMSHTHEELVVVGMHGRAIRILLSWLLEVPLSEMDQFPHQNLCLYHLRYQHGRYEVLKANDVSHLQHYALCV